ncbi:MAG TPA: methyltransferase domain-containing protein [Sedimentisphaerales bacterium]|nr:methyltransferase domain-containing protein [Sedimentisphaerales bacterium]
MRVILRLILSVVLTAAFFAGCETTRDIQYDREPAARLEAMRFGGVELDYATVLFDVEIDNPYRVSLPLQRLRYALVSDGRTFLTATVFDNVTVPPNTKKVLTLSDEVTYTRLLKALHGKPGSKIPFKAELTLSLDTPGSGWINLHAEKEGNIVLPESPEINVEGITYNAVDVIFVPTPQDVVDKMLQLAEVRKDDLLYDLGCGDGRIVVTAARRYGCMAEGFDIDPRRVEESLENVQKNKVGHLVKIEQKDIFTLDLSKADVITLFLLSRLNVKLIPQLEKLKPGSRIVSHIFAMEGIKPDKVVTLISKEDKSEHTIYLWTTPLKKETGE